MRFDLSGSRLAVLALCLFLALSVVGAPVMAQSGEMPSGDESDATGDGAGTGTETGTGADTGVGTDDDTGADTDTDTGSDAGTGPSVSGEVTDGTMGNGIAGGDADQISGDESGGSAGGPATGPGSGSGGGTLGGLGPSPSEWGIDLIRGLFNDYVVQNIEDGIDYFHQEGIGIPAPGEFGDRSTWTTDVSQPISEWGNDMEGYWSGATIAHYTSGAAGILWLLIQLLNSGFASAEERRDQRKRIGIAFLMILTGAHLTAPFILHAINEVGLQFAPEGADFTGSIGNLARLGIGIIFGAILLTISSFSIVIGFISIEVIDFMVIAIYSIWGLMWAGWASRGQAQSFGYQGIFTLGGIGALTIVQALLTLTIFNISWTSSFFSPLEVLIGTSIGLGVTYILLPYVFLQHTFRAASTYLGAGAALASSKIDAALEQHVFDRGEQYDEETKSGNGNDPTYDRPMAGSVQSASSGGGSGGSTRGRGTVADGGSSGRPDAASWGSPPRDSAGRFVSRDEYDSNEADRINHKYD